MMTAPRPLPSLGMFLAALALTSCGAAASKASYEGAVSEPYYGTGGSGYAETGYAGADYSEAYSEEAMAYPTAPASMSDDMGGEGWAAVTGVFDGEDEAGIGDGMLAYADIPKDKAPPPPAPAPEQPAPGEHHEKPDTATDAGGQGTDRIILYVAEMNIAVFRVEEKIDEIRKLIKDWGGYMISMDSSRIEFRVPAGKFEDAMETIEGLGDVTYRNVTGTDVTDEYMDLQIRLKNAIAVRDRLLELLSQTKNINESLQVEAELERITEKIELMKGRIKYLSEAAAYSRITVYLSVKMKAKKPIPSLYAPFQWIQDVGLDSLFNF